MIYILALKTKDIYSHFLKIHSTFCVGIWIIALASVKTHRSQQRAGPWGSYNHGEHVLFLWTSSERRRKKNWNVLCFSEGAIFYFPGFSDRISTQHREEVVMVVGLSSYESPSTIHPLWRFSLRLSYPETDEYAGLTQSLSISMLWTVCVCAGNDFPESLRFNDTCFLLHTWVQQLPAVCICINFPVDSHALHDFI